MGGQEGSGRKGNTSAKKGRRKVYTTLRPGRELPHLAFSRALGSSLRTILLRKAECPVSRVRRQASLCLYLQEGKGYRGNRSRIRSRSIVYLTAWASGAV